MAGVLSSTAAAVGILDKAVSITQKLANNSDELDKATLKLELANLMVELADAKIEAITTQTLIFDAEQKNKHLEEQLVDKSTFVFKPPLYWKEGDETPFCPRCYEGDNKKHHLRSIVTAGNRAYGILPKNNWSCLHCKFSNKKNS
ncbi:MULTISPECIES: hypothetical protein [unclassified Enterobacter]|jgi:hypothetical protein|uniref:hypothetical protein n=1 Tax=unclassified Enterobacter TaxID=2608935 RepID=UPI00292B5936|nr:hypothetical protein [Enterobacter sp. 23-M-SZ-13]MDV0593493.1 hypothetical protein [Enterobacter sp. 23-M-SZ-13]